MTRYCKGYAKETILQKKKQRNRKGVLGGKQKAKKEAPLKKSKMKGIFIMKKITPLRAIRQKCLDCCCFQPKEVTLCTAENCPLFPYRMGKRPRQGNYTTDESYSKKTAPTTAENEKESN